MRRLRKLVLAAFTIGSMAALFLIFMPVLLAWPTRRWRQNVSRVYSKWWSRSVLWAAGIRLVVRGREHLRTRPAVITFNHVSELDFFVCACLAPRDSLVFGKRELRRVPFLGWMWALGAHPMIQRDDRHQWQALLDDVQAQLATGRYCTVVAPEGKRTRDGLLLPFKKGPFQVALQSGAPVLPLVLHGVAPLMTRADGFKKGTIEVDVLPPIPTSGWSPEQLDLHVEEVRGAYLRTLGQAEPAEVG